MATVACAAPCMMAILGLDLKMRLQQVGVATVTLQSLIFICVILAVCRAFFYSAPSEGVHEQTPTVDSP